MITFRWQRSSVSSDVADQTQFDDVHADFGINHRAQRVAQTFFCDLLCLLGHSSVHPT